MEKMLFSSYFYHILHTDFDCQTEKGSTTTYHFLNHGKVFCVKENTHIGCNESYSMPYFANSMVAIMTLSAIINYHWPIC
jgi:hypothetical protein